MLLLILGLILFLGVHSTRLFAPEWRAKQIAAKGLMAWKGIYALASIVGLVLIIYGHPMLLGVKFWALAHLLANGALADLLLFGGFLAWAVALFVVSRKRDRLVGVSYGKGKPAMDALAVIVGLVAWAAFAFYLHGVLIGVKPMGM